MKYQTDTPAKRGQTIRQETGRDRSDDKAGHNDALSGDAMKGDRNSISHSIRDGKVPEE